MTGVWGEKGRLPPQGGAGAPQVGGTGAREEPSLPDPDRELSPLPPKGQQPQQGVLVGASPPDVRLGPTLEPDDTDNF